MQAFLTTISEWLSYIIRFFTGRGNAPFADEIDAAGLFIVVSFVVLGLQWWNKKFNN